MFLCGRVCEWAQNGLVPPTVEKPRLLSQSFRVQNATGESCDGDRGKVPRSCRCSCSVGKHPWSALLQCRFLPSRPFLHRASREIRLHIGRHTASFGRRAESAIPLFVPKKKAPLPSRYFALTQVPRVPRTNKHECAMPKAGEACAPTSHSACFCLGCWWAIWSLPMALTELTQVQHSRLPFDHLRGWRTANESCRVNNGAGPAAQVRVNLVCR